MIDDAGGPSEICLRRYRAIFESAVDFAIIAMDRDGLITDWNPGAAAIFGWSASEVIGGPANRFFTPEDRAAGRVIHEMARALEAGRGNDERWHLRKDGTRFWANGEMMPLLDAGGEHVGFLKIVRDETERREAEERRRIDQEFMRSVMAASDDCIKVLDLDAKLVFMSEGGQRVMDVSDFNAIRGCPWPDFWHGALNVKAKAAVAAAKAGGSGRFEGVTNTFAGTPRWWDVRVTPILDGEGRPEKILSISRDVTESRAASERVELALNAGAIVGTWVWDISKDRFTADARFARTFSLRPEELAAGVSLDLVVASIHPDDAARVDAAIKTAMAQGGRYSEEHRVIQPDGSWLWIEANGHCDLDEAGQAIRFPGALIDIDRRKRHELRQEALLILGERLRGMSDATLIAQAAAETLGRTLHVDRAGYAWVDVQRGIITVERDWCANPSVASIARVHRVADYGTYFENLLRSEALAVSDVERDPRTMIGSRSLRSIQIKAMLNVPVLQDGQVVALMFLNQDKTRTWSDDETDFVRAVADRTWAALEQARAEAALRQANEQLEGLVEIRTQERDRVWDATRDLMATAGLDGYLKQVNPAWTRMLGWSEAELLERPFTELIDPADLAETADVVRRLSDGLSVQGFVDRVIRKDGERRFIMWDAVPDGVLFHIVGRDMTDLRVMEEQLRQSQKMEAVGQLTGGIAHDFNNLLTGITGSLELLQTRIRQGRLSEIDKYVAAAQSASQRAAALTHRLLAFSRRQTLDPKPTDVNRLISEMAELVRRTVGPSIVVETVSAADLWTTMIDPGQLENALLNLCINARDAMPAGGQITIATGNRCMDRGAAHTHDLPPGQYVSMCVSDTGIGMPADVIARAFDPFFTTKPIGQGTGLGLSMIYGFVRQSGGHVRIYSEVGKGTTVCLYLARHHGAAEQASELPALAEAPRAQDGETVLVVDDEPSVRMLVTETLEDLGYNAIEAADGPSGLKVLLSDVRVDLLVSDVGLPGTMNGRQMADAGRVRRPGLKVLFITGFAENAVVGDGHLDVGMHVMTKPFAMEALAARIKELISPG